MNYELANAVADEIEVAGWTGDALRFSHTRTANKPDLFDMGTVLYTSRDAEGTCGTVACIAGWILVHVQGTHEATQQDHPLGAARRFLDISHAEADVLFSATGTNLEDEIEDIDPSMAAIAIRRGIAQHRETGTFDGSIWDW